MANRLLILKVSKSTSFEQNSEFLSLRKKNYSLPKRKCPETGKHTICQQQTAV